MTQYKLKNGHTLELSGGRGVITGIIEEDRYQALIKENPNFANEFVEHSPEQSGKKKGSETKTEQ